MEENHINEDYKEEFVKVIDKGLSIYMGEADFDSEDILAYLLEGLWERLEEASEDTFIGLDTSLEFQFPVF